MSPLCLSVSFDKADALRHAFKIAFLWHSKAAAWAVSDGGSLIFYWSATEGTHPLPVPLDADGAADLAINWLKDQPITAFGREPDHDGDNKRGYRVSNQGPAVNSGSSRELYAILAVTPEWTEYHK
jgi:hypothetical protein